MTKQILLLAAFAFSFTAFAKEPVKKEIEKKEKEDTVGRQCCSKAYASKKGAVVIVTACSGWFLSNDAKSYSAACAMVDEAIEGQKKADAGKANSGLTPTK